MNKVIKAFTLILITSQLFTACNKGGIDDDDYGIFYYQDEATVIIDGLIDSDLPTYWSNYISDFPNTELMIMKDCPGSTDDIANWEAAKEIHEQGVSIHLPSDAIIASGAVDLFLAGVNRTREAGSKIGVHSWEDGNGNQATDYPVGHEEHQGAIDYYIDVGFSKEDAEAFYYFTINIASFDDIHWMTDEEIEQYNLLNP